MQNAWKAQLFAADKTWNFSREYAIMTKRELAAESCRQHCTNNQKAELPNKKKQNVPQQSTRPQRASSKAHSIYAAAKTQSRRGQFSQR